MDEPSDNAEFQQALKHFDEGDFDSAEALATGLVSRGGPRSYHVERL